MQTDCVVFVVDEVVLPLLYLDAVNVIYHCESLLNSYVDYTLNTWSYNYGDISIIEKYLSNICVIFFHKMYLT